MLRPNKEDNKKGEAFIQTFYLLLLEENRNRKYMGVLGNIHDDRARNGLKHSFNMLPDSSIRSETHGRPTFKALTRMGKKMIFL